MRDIVYIISTDELLEEYSKKLTSLINNNQGFEAKHCTFDEYKSLESLSDIMFDNARLVFMGTKILEQLNVLNFMPWKYEKFGCRIGWKENKCVIFARDTELPYSDYKDFRDYCVNMKSTNSNVIVPPENPFIEGFEAVKGFFLDKENQSANRAQYSTLIYEFINNYFSLFIESENNMEVILRGVKSTASTNMTKEQLTSCNKIIHTTALGCAAIAFFPIPIADTFPITAAQIQMTIKLSEVFKNKLTKSDAQILLKAAAAPYAGRIISKAGLVFIPGVGWAVNGTIAGVITEILGWSIANYFVNKSKR